MTALAGTRPWSDPPVRISGRERGDDWRDDAACRGESSDLWFSDVGEYGNESRATQRARETDVAHAIATCHTCPVITACADYVTKHPDWTRYGIWAGKTARQRTAARKDARYQKRKQP